MAKGGQKDREREIERQRGRQTDRWTDSRTCSKRTAAAAAAAATGSHRRFKYLNRRQTIEHGRAGASETDRDGQTFR